MSNSLPSGVVFDMDGLLLDSERIAQECFVEACRAQGLEPDLSMYQRCIGASFDAVQHLLIQHYGKQLDFSVFSQSWAQFYEGRVLDEPVALKKGVVALLERIQALRIPMAVATSTGRYHADIKLANANIRPFFELIVTADDVSDKKPHPAPYLKAVAGLQCEPRLCWAFEDSNTGVRSAAAAGLLVYQVPDLVQPDNHSQQVTHLTLSSLRDAMALFD